MEHVFHSERALNATTTTSCQGQRSRAGMNSHMKKTSQCGVVCKLVCLCVYSDCTRNYLWADLPHPANDPLRNSLSQKPLHLWYCRAGNNWKTKTHTHTHMSSLSVVSALLVKMETPAECVSVWLSDMLSPPLSLFLILFISCPHISPCILGPVHQRGLH